jgi:uncharacterized membrane protein YfcA
VPLALYALPLAGVHVEPHAVTALSLVQGICAFAAGGLAYARRGHVDFGQLKLGGPALGIGGLAGGVASAAAPATLLVVVFAVVVSAATGLLLLPPPSSPPRVRGAPVVAACLFAAIGALGGAAGIGAGVLVIPVLLYLLGMPPRTASGTGLVLPVFISGPAFAGKALTGQMPWELVPIVAATSLVGVLAGSRATLAASPGTLRLVLAGLTGALALTVWVRLLHP